MKLHTILLFCNLFLVHLVVGGGFVATCKGFRYKSKGQICASCKTLPGSEHKWNYSCLDIDTFLRNDDGTVVLGRHGSVTETCIDKGIHFVRGGILTAFCKIKGRRIYKESEIELGTYIVTK
ncbi:hypothetical protein BJ508DRAFT_338484 [Ascobolus immersus RN42]|uniref:Cyanovirin-N domain-containing protein n=1 Tax=Ascobolus immersus RN42 TaxID=1160509 RepID=A0A3N4HPX3_ASCIM|nr:hypothetical protein BJ508DRAFT_338484 [Ascobolus immersus RN42]